MREILNKFNDYMDLETALSQTSKTKYTRIVRMFLMKMSIKYSKISFTIEDINRFIVSKTSEKRRGTNVKYALKAFLISIGKHDWAEHRLKPVKTNPRQKKFPYFTQEIMNRIIHLLPMPYKGIAFIQSHSGARFREATTVKIQDIDVNMHPNLIFIKIGEYAKGLKARTLSMRKEHQGILMEMIAKRSYGFMLLGPECNNYNSILMDKQLDKVLNTYNIKLNAIGRSLGLTGLSSHYIRHHFADTFMLMPGSDIYKLKTILGHAKIETTKEYISVGDKITNEFIANSDTVL